MFESKFSRFWHNVYSVWKYFTSKWITIMTMVQCTFMAYLLYRGNLTIFRFKKMHVNVIDWCLNNFLLTVPDHHSKAIKSFVVNRPSLEVLRTIFSFSFKTYFSNWIYQPSSFPPFALVCHFNRKRILYFDLFLKNFYCFSPQEMNWQKNDNWRVRIFTAWFSLGFVWFVSSDIGK